MGDAAPLNHCSLHIVFKCFAKTKCILNDSEILVPVRLIFRVFFLVFDHKSMHSRYINISRLAPRGSATYRYSTWINPHNGDDTAEWIQIKETSNFHKRLNG